MGNEPSVPNDKIDFLRPVQKKAPEPTQINKVQQNEWRIGLQHPHLLQTLGGQPEGDQYRYFFEFCQITLTSLLQERYGTKKYFPEEDLQALLLGISSALSFLQEKGLSHGDICTQEIFFDSNSSSFKVLDSNLINGRGASIQQLLSGKLKYLAPEILQNPTQPLSEIQLSKNDVWCLGMVMLEASTLKQNDNLYQNGLQFRLIQDTIIYQKYKINYLLFYCRINEVAQIYNLQYAENIALMLNFNPNERLDPVNLFNYLLEQQRNTNEQDQMIVQQQQYKQLLQQQQLYQQQLCQQQQQQQQQQLLYQQQQQQQQLTYQQAQQSQLQYQQQQPIQYLPQQVEQQNLQQQQQVQPTSQLQQTQIPSQYYQQQQMIQQQQQQYNTQQTQYQQQQQFTQTQTQTQQTRQNYHQARPSQDFMMTQPDMNQTMQGGVSRERVPTKIIKKLVYPDGRVEYQEKSQSASRMVQQPQQQKQQQMIPQQQQLQQPQAMPQQQQIMAQQQQMMSQQQQMISQQQQQQQFIQQPQYNPQYQQQQYCQQSQPQYQQRQNILGNIENQMHVVSNEQNITRLKQEIDNSKTLIQQYNQQKPQVQAESIEERIRKVIAQSQALRENFA